VGRQNVKILKRGLLIGLMVITIGMAACSGEGAKDLYETAQLEELQKNREHAIELYKEILQKHPDSEYAKKAEERLTAMGKSR